MKIMRFFLPPTCVLCHGEARDHDLCEPCNKELPWLKNTCKCCALPLTDATQVQCGRCQKTPPYYDATIALFDYAEPISNMVNNFKFHQKLLYGHLFGKLLAEKLHLGHKKQSLPELLIPVPLHASRLRERGYNQALELTRPIAKALKLKLNYRDLIRMRKTEQQALTIKERRKTNIHGAFTLVKPLAAKYVALIDDVITTGYTVNECSKILKKHGVEKIIVLAIARTNLG